MGPGKEITVMGWLTDREPIKTHAAGVKYEIERARRKREAKKANERAQQKRREKEARARNRAKNGW
jgi:hypothetical protein